MNLTALVTLLVAAVIFGAGLVALMVLCSIAFPKVVARARHNAEAMPIRSLVVGLINFVFFGLIAAAFLSGREGGQVIGIVIATILFSFVAVGVAAVARLVGERLMPNAANPVRQVMAGALTIALSTLTPLVGWFVVPVLVGLIGYGALIIALIWRRSIISRRSL